MKKKLTMEDHLLLARQVRRIAAEISAVHGITSGYRLVSTVGCRLFALQNKLLELKSALDSLMFRDHPKDPRAKPDVYYGTVDRRDRS